MKKKVTIGLTVLSVVVYCSFALATLFSQNSPAEKWVLFGLI